MALAADPYNTDDMLLAPASWRLRLRLGDAAVAAAHAAMLHAAARGYLKSHRASAGCAKPIRRPSSPRTKQLRRCWRSFESASFTRPPTNHNRRGLP